MTDVVEELGIKLPTEDDWLQPDSVWRNFVTLTPEGNAPFVRYDAVAWIHDVRQYEVPRAPREVKALFEVARSAIIYGYLCYPLLTLGTEQLHRVLEAAVRLKAKALGWAPKAARDRHRNDLPDYRDGLDYLKQKGAVAPYDEEWWNSARLLRNDASHPGIQTIHPPSTALTTIRLVAEKINALFAVEMQ